GQAVRIERDLDRGWGGAGDVDPGRAGEALEARLEGLVDQRILVAEVAVAGETDAQHRLVGRRELQHLVALQVVGQLVADGVEAVAGLGGRDLDVTVPVGELDEDDGAVRPAGRSHAADAGQGRQRLLRRAGNRAFDLLRRAARVWKVHQDEGDVHVREHLQRPPERGDQAYDHQRDVEHHGRHRPA